MVSLLGTAGPPEGGYLGVDPGHVWRTLEGAWCDLGRLACAVGSLRGVLDIFGNNHGRVASPDFDRLAEIGDVCSGGSVGIGLACHTLDRSCRVLLRGCNNRPISIGEGKYLVCRGIRVTHGPKKIVYKEWKSDVVFADLPEDVLRKIFSNLQLNEIVSTSVLSSSWRSVWAVSSKLHFDCTAICGQHRCFTNNQKCLRKFVDGVNLVLQQLNGEVFVEVFKVKVEFDLMLVEHLNNWIRFAMRTLVKSLSLDLLPAQNWDLKYMYIFPFELFDDAGCSRIRHIQLSCVTFKPCAEFRCFPNLRKLDLQLFDTSGKDLGDMLSWCSNLEWLSLNRWRTEEDELKVKKPLSRLMYLCIVHCWITELELHAENLKTFIYHGPELSIDLGQVKQLETANVNMHYVTLEYALTVLPHVLHGV